eukprot:CAMPEP_0114320746 /NCGR_PEP_ID=MMETSP0059-20121206/26136_1 /TAXON_ID=36894 /ORGANISM="Pyramimonas parkeae, Strain CCMP726" /LENGTH=157 /DNA_ID=CAMNT_0001448235 /DNA_START=1202 /DNA_END=1674 /DNA_ORIENTATION=-
MPSILATLTSLITLDLSINELSGTIPKEWPTLTNLRYMSLYHNQLGGTVPNELAKLLVGTVPNELAKLSKLSFMYLCHNALLCGNIPDGFALGKLILGMYGWCNIDNSLVIALSNPVLCQRDAEEDANELEFHRASYRHCDDTFSAFRHNMTLYPWI